MRGPARRTVRTDLLRTRRHQDAPAAAEALERRALLSSPGSFDTTFGDDGVVTRNLLTVDGVSIADAAFQADGKILLAGNAGGNLVLARFNADGSLDRSFGAGGGMVPLSLRYVYSDVARRCVAAHATAPPSASPHLGNPRNDATRV